MGPFEYIALLTSIVIALGITRLLTGVGKILQLRGHVRVYWVHTIWAGKVFLRLLLHWRILYRWRTYDSWTFFLYLFVLLSPVIAFLLSVLLLPEPLEPGTDLKRVYFENHRWFFALAALLPPIDALAEGPGPLRGAGAVLRRHDPAPLRSVHRRRHHRERTLSRVLLRLLPALHSGVHRGQPPVAGVGDLARHRALAFPGHDGGTDEPDDRPANGFHEQGRFGPARGAAGLT